MSKCFNPFMVENPAFPALSDRRKIPAPCGKCPPCLKRKSNAWAFRLRQHDRIADTSCMLTLTYDTDHVPISKNGFMTADSKAFPLFIKRLRKYLYGSKKSNLKYYAVIEYGSTRSRPHYHAILFNLPDIEWTIDVQGQDIGFSNSVQSCWQFGGYDIRRCSGATVGYVVKYLHKGNSVPKHRNDDRVPERSFMSKGLGQNYITEETVRYHKDDLAKTYVVQDNHKMSIPRYYRDKIYTEEERRLQSIEFEKSVVEQDRKARVEYSLVYGTCPLIPYTEHVRQLRTAAFINFKARAASQRKDL